MAISYNIYANDGKGGVVDYRTPIATTTGKSFITTPLSVSSDNIFAVRAFDTLSGVEEANTEARVRIEIDPAGNDVTNRPNAVVGLSNRLTAGSTCWVSWGYDPTGQGGPPVSFQLTLSSNPSTPIANPTATVAYLPGVSGYGCSFSGLPDNTPCTISVWAIGLTSLLIGPVASVSVTSYSTVLSGVDSLVAMPKA